MNAQRKTPLLDRIAARRSAQEQARVGGAVGREPAPTRPPWLQRLQAKDMTEPAR